MMRNRELLEGDLRPQQQEVLKNYMENVEEYLLHMTELAFCEGFSLASRLLVEALGRERERYRPNAQKREVPGGGSPRPTLGLK